jgi:very-short-patch-repair endonuclease
VPAPLFTTFDRLAGGRGVVPARALRAAGVRREDIAVALQTKALRRPFRGVYSRTNSGGVAEIRIAVTAMRATASHLSAAVIHELPLLASTAEIHVTIPRKNQRVSRTGVRTHWATLGTDVTMVDGIAVTTVLRTLLDCARVLPLTSAVALADAALARMLVTADELQNAAARARGRGAAQIRQMAALADARAESPLESVLRATLALAGLPPTDVQYEVRDEGRVIARADLAFAEQRIVIEAEGFGSHGTRAGLQRDCRRGNAYAVREYALLRFSWEDVMHDPDYVIETVRELVERRTMPVPVNRAA